MEFDKKALIFFMSVSETWKARLSSDLTEAAEATWDGTTCS